MMQKRIWLLLIHVEGIQKRSFNICTRLSTSLGSNSTINVPVDYSKSLKLIENTKFVGLTANSRQYASIGTKLQTTANKKMTKLTEQERAEVLQPLLNVGWTIVNGRDAIYKEYLFKDFNHAFSFMSGIALLAEKMNHHPEWFNVYNKVQVTMSTHDAGGLSAKDIRMAKYMEEHSKRFL